MNVNRFDSILFGVCPRLRDHLYKLPEYIKNQAEELRLRAGLPVTLTVKGNPLFLCENGGTATYLAGNLLKAQSNDLYESFLLLCKNSVYAHTAELKEGYLRMPSGHRAGVCGTFSQDGSLKEITSLNIRISHQIKGSADQLVDEFDGGGFLIAGPPGSGKTTVLRDMIRQLSDGAKGVYLRVAAVDTRGELSGGADPVMKNDLGNNTDVLMIGEKATGVEIALRTLFPDIIAFDEIGTANELKTVSQSFHAGVCVITTAHAGSINDLKRRSVTSQLLESGAISKVAILSPKTQKPTVYSCEEVLYASAD